MTAKKANELGDTKMITYNKEYLAEDIAPSKLTEKRDESKSKNDAVNSAGNQLIDYNPDSVNGNGHKPHPIASIFPKMSEDEFRELKKSIKDNNGLREPIWLCDGQILDGRNRYRACLEEGIEPKFRQYEGDSPISFVIDLNLKRRHLNPSQRACIAAEALPLLAQEAKERQRQHGGTAPGQTAKTLVEKIPQVNGKARHKAAQVAHVNEHYVSDANKILTEAPEVFQEVKAGDTTIRAALNKIRVKSGGSERCTPANIIEAVHKVLGQIDVDPASSEEANKIVGAVKYYTTEDDGLKQEWLGKVLLNPPSAKISQFCELLVQKFHNKEVLEAIVLVNNATETAWFQTMLGECSAVCFPKGRIKFFNEEGEPLELPLQGQAILYFGGNTKSFSDVFSPFGKVLFCQK
jgi:phage N-6-adenine-methyltransferase